MNRFQEIAFGKTNRENYLMTRAFREPREQRYSTRRFNSAAPGTVRVAQPTTAISNGYQFKFYVLGGNIDGYRIYRSTINNPNVASVVDYIPQPPSFTINSTLTWQETTTGTIYYWVSAVSPTGREGPRAKIPMTGTAVSPSPPDSPPVPDPGEGGGGGGGSGGGSWMENS